MLVFGVFCTCRDTTSHVYINWKILIWSSSSIDSRWYLVMLKIVWDAFYAFELWQPFLGQIEHLSPLRFTCHLRISQIGEIVAHFFSIVCKRMHGIYFISLGICFQSTHSEKVTCM